MHLYEIEKNMKRLSEREVYCKKLYKRTPQAFQNPVVTWNDFCLQYNTCAQKPIPKEEWNKISIISRLVEQDHFKKPGLTVAALTHPRYMPPHLHSHAFIKVIYILKGQCTIFADGNSHELVRGDFIIVSPNVEHAVFSHHDEDIAVNILMRYSTFESSYFSILSDKSFLSEFFWKMLYTQSSNKLLLFRCGEDKRLDRNVLELYEEYVYEEECSDMLLKSYVILLLSLLLKRHGHQIIPLQKVHEKYNNVSSWLRYMEENLRSVSLPRLSEEFRMSEAHISRMIHRETGYTFRTILQDMRVKHAAQMLKNSTLSIESIAELVGYTDPSRLYRSFKAEYGRTPSAYRNEMELISL